MFFRWAFLLNQWLWFHLIAGAVLAKILNYWLLPPTTILIILSTALLWEAGEWLFTDTSEVYGSRKRFFADAVGDISGAVLMSAIVVF